ncbi:MAG: hypothetical protein ACPGWS_06510 [Solirubrobacterales bacterium]
MTFGYAIAGTIVGGLLGGLWAFFLLEFQVTRQRSPALATRNSLLGIGAETANATLYALPAACFIYDYYAWQRSGPIIAATYVVALAIGLTSVVFKLWVVSPKRFADHEYDPTKISDGGQRGLAHRGFAVAGWAGIMLSVAPLLLISWYMVGVANANLSQGFAIGTGVGVLAITYVAISARGSYSDRVLRHKNRLGGESWRPVARIVVSSLAVFVGFVALVDTFGFCVAFFTLFTACGWGLIATIVDRWVITPRKLANYYPDSGAA